MKRKLSFVMLIVAAMLFFSSVQSEFAHADDGLEDLNILDIDSYEKTADPGDTVTYNWTIHRTDTTPKNYTVYINVTGIEDGWTALVVPNVIPSLPNQSARKVTLTVTCPLDTDDREQNLTVTFTVIEDNAPILVENRNAVTNIYVEPPATERKWFFGMFENSLPPPLDGDVGVFLMDVLVWLGISFLIFIVLNPVIKLLTRKTKTELDDIVLGIVRTPVLVLVFTFGIVTSAKHLDSYLPEMVIDYLNKIWGIVFLLVLLYMGWKLFKDILIYYGKRVAAKTESKIDDIVIPLVEKVGMVIIMLVAVMYFMGYIGIDLTMFVAGGVVVSMVIAFAAQETISNFFSGIFLMTDRPFNEGDTIILPDGDWYEVRSVGIRSTKLFRFKDASIVTIPNNKLANEKITNFSDVADKARVELTVGVAYGSDPEKVKKIIHEVINNCEYIVLDDENIKPVVWFEELGESSINFYIRVRVKERSYQYRFGTKDYLNTQLYKRFTEEGIEIPFPQTVVHIKQEPEKSG
ncbi:MAG: mechanosensitive ion channel [Thermoplasmata archaeon]|nr:mechanosensitive ion channel [Thermoplasmata archaeon]